MPRYRQLLTYGKHCRRLPYSPRKSRARISPGWREYCSSRASKHPPRNVLGEKPNCHLQSSKRTSLTRSTMMVSSTFPKTGSRQIPRYDDGSHLSLSGPLSRATTRGHFHSAGKYPDRIQLEYIAVRC